MSSVRTILAAAIALAFVACSGTPTATDAVDGLAFAGGPPAKSGVVERVTVRQFFVITDIDAGLRATVGFDRVGWCGRGLGTGDAFVDHLDLISPQDVTTTLHGDGQRTAFTVSTGILVVYVSGFSLRDCGGPLVGTGTGRTAVRFIGPVAGGNPGGLLSDIFLQNSGGFITAIADGSRKRVNVASTHLDGVRMNPSSIFHEINARIIVR